jgi:Protease inhibitor Inh
VDRPRRLGLATLVVALAVSSAAHGQSNPDLASLLGSWDLSLQGANRRCRVMLAIDETPVGRMVRFPAGCRRALPILNSIAGWGAAAKDRLDLIDSRGTAALRFEEDDDGFTARTPGGETFRLERPEGVVQEVRLPPPPPPVGVPRVTPVDPAKAPPLASLPGTYVVDRYSEREVCRIDLGRAMLTSAGRYEARLMDGCRDLGLAAFDPVAWRYEGGRLTLTARRGHEVTLISERDGHWRRDPEVGATLVLRKLAAP